MRACAGTGKTLLARACAAECGASFLAIQPSTVASKWLGDGVRYVRACFSLASKLAPCVLFVDEVGAGCCTPLCPLAAL
jgi:ATP-dependent 26S proteasome regulatory subunit